MKKKRIEITGQHTFGFLILTSVWFNFAFPS